jgi:hypothetical protein
MVHDALTELVVSHYSATLLELGVSQCASVHDLAPLGRGIINTIEMSILAQICILLLDIMMNTLLEGVYVRISGAVGCRNISLDYGAILLLGSGILCIRAKNVATCTTGDMLFNHARRRVLCIERSYVIIVIVPIEEGLHAVSSKEKGILAHLLLIIVLPIAVSILGVEVVFIRG